MLTSDLLRTRVKEGQIEPRLIDTKRKRYKEKAQALIEIYTEHVGSTRGQLDESIRDQIGSGTDYLIQRGLSKLLSDRSTFEVSSPILPRELRREIFERMAQNYPLPLESDEHYPVSRTDVLAEVGALYDLTAEEVDQALYADLQDAYRLTEFDSITTEKLLHRYNLALTQALLFRATHLRIELWDVTAQRLRQIVRYIKFFRLIAWVRPLTNNRYRIELDGPMSLFRFCQKYGLQMASFLPALLLCENWSLEAEIKWEDKKPPFLFKLNSETDLVSHYPNKGVYVTEEESHFRKRWKKVKTEWELSPKTQIIRLGTQEVIVTDYVLRHPDGREVLIFLVGFWQRHTLIKKLELIEEYGPENLLIAAPARLRASQDDLETLSDRLYFFKDVIQGKRVAALADSIYPQTE